MPVHVSPRLIDVKNLRGWVHDVTCPGRTADQTLLSRVREQLLAVACHAAIARHEAVFHTPPAYPFRIVAEEHPEAPSGQLFTIRLLVDEPSIRGIADPERRGLYWEEIEKLVDGVVADLETGAVTHPIAAERQLRDAAAESSYVHDVDLAVEVLFFSQHPCAALDTLGEGASPFDLLRAQTGFRPGDDFPWRDLARAAIQDDCSAQLQTREAYRALAGAVLLV